MFVTVAELHLALSIAALSPLFVRHALLTAARSASTMLHPFVFSFERSDIGFSVYCSRELNRRSTRIVYEPPGRCTHVPAAIVAYFKFSLGLNVSAPNFWNRCVV